MDTNEKDAPLALRDTQEPQGSDLDNLLGWCKENTLVAGAIGFAALAIFTGAGGNVAETNAKNDALKAARYQNQYQVRALAVQDQALEDLAEIANKRLASGRCVEVVHGENSRSTTIFEGQVVVDPVSGNPLAENTLVCDRLGNTGIIQNGVVTGVAQGTPPAPPAVTEASQDTVEKTLTETVYVIKSQD